MTFSTLLWIILFGYAAYYGGLITYDEFRKDDIPLEAKVDEEEIDISGEASEFHPKDVKKESKNKQNEKEEREEGMTIILYLVGLEVFPAWIVHHHNKRTFKRCANNFLIE